MRIKDIAREAGVSTATVSNVMNGTRNVSEKTRVRVCEAIERFKFLPNRLAQSLASGRSNIIGLLVSDISNPYFSEIVKSIEIVVNERGYHLFLLNTNYNARRTVEDVRRLLQLKVAGIILMTSEFDPSLITEATEHKTPFVFHNLGSVGENMSSVSLDYAAGIEEAVQHLVSLGHEEIAHIAGSLEIHSSVVRLQSFLDSMKRHQSGVEEPKIYSGDFRFEGGRKAANQIMAERNRPTAVISANDLMALGAMYEFKIAGLRIPQDISVVGFDDITYAAYAEPPLTTICSPRAEIGRLAVEALMLKLERLQSLGIEIRIPTYLVIRHSTAPPER